MSEFQRQTIFNQRVELFIKAVGLLLTALLAPDIAAKLFH
jgi:hypothetical protein